MLSHKLRLQSKFLANSLNLPQQLGKDLLARAIYCTSSYGELRELLYKELSTANIIGSIQHHWLKYILICECEDELLIDDLHKSIEYMAKRLETMVVINISKIRLISILYELFGLGDEAKYIISAPKNLTLNWKPCFNTLINNIAALYCDFKVNNIEYRLVATQIKLKQFTFREFEKSIVKSLKQKDSEEAKNEKVSIEEHRHWLLNSVNFFSDFDSFYDDKIPHDYEIEGQKYVVYGFPLSSHLVEKNEVKLPVLRVSIKDVPDKQIFILQIGQQKLTLECIYIDTPAISVINYCEFSNGVKETLLNHKDARKFPTIIHQSYFSGSIRPFCDMDHLENSI